MWPIVARAGLLLLFSLTILPSPDVRAQVPADTRTDDPLPEGAVLRLGSDRFRQEGEVQQVRYSPDGKKLASVSRDAIILWDARSGRKEKRLHPRDDARFASQFSAVAFSPDGEEVAAFGASRIHVWELETGLELLSFPVDSQDGFVDHSEIHYSPNGERLAVTGGMGALLYDTTTGAQTAKLTIDNHRASIEGLCWAPDGTHLVVSTLDPAAVAWEVKSGKLVQRFLKPDKQSFATAPAMSADGKTLLAATGGTVHLWDFASGDLRKSIPLDADWVNTLVLTPDNKTLIVGSQDGMIRIVDVEAGAVTRKIDGRLWIGRSLAVSPDFKTVALGAVFPTIRQWDIETGEELFSELTAKGHDAEVDCGVWSPDGRLIASGGANHQINLWDARTGKPRLKISSPSSANRMTFTPSGRHLVTSWKNAGAIRVWDVDSGKQVRSIECGTKKVRAFIPTHDAKRLIAVVSDSPYEWHSPVGEEAIQVWDFEAGQKLHEFKFQTASTESAALSLDGRSLVTGSANGIIHVFDIESGDERATLPGHAHSVTGLAFSSDGTLLASGSYDQSIRLWDAKMWKSVRVLKGHERAVTSVAFSPDGRLLASGSGTRSYPLNPQHSQRIRLWDVRSGEQIGALSGHNTNTSAVAFSPDGKRLLSAHSDTTLLVWDVSPFAGR